MPNPSHPSQTSSPSTNQVHALSLNSTLSRCDLVISMESEYRDRHVSPKLPQRPGLAILDEFMDPCNKCFVVPPEHRQSKFDITVLHVHESKGVQQPIICRSPEIFELAMRLQNSRTDGDTSALHLEGWVAEEDRSGTIIFTEDLSLDMVDVLGTKYSIEPEFFADHLRGSETFRMGKWQPASVRAPKILPSCTRQAPFYSLEFRRPYHLSKGLEDVIDLRSRVTNIPRAAQIIMGKPDVFVFEKVSVYKKKDSKIAAKDTFARDQGLIFGGYSGIILTEKLLTDDPPAPELLDPVGSLDGNFPSNVPLPSDRRKQVSCRDELVGWLQQLPKEEVLALFNNNNSEPLALCPILKVIEANSVMFLAYAQNTIIRFLTRHCDKEFPDSIQFALRVLRHLHGYIHDQQRFLQENIRVAYLKGGQNIEEQTKDIECLMQGLERVLKALEEDLRFFVFISSIKEGKLVAMVSKLAFLFLPVSAWTAVMSINGPGQEGYTRFIIFGSLTIPSLLISNFIIFFWKPSNIDSLEF